MNPALKSARKKAAKATAQTQQNARAALKSIRAAAVALENVERDIADPKTSSVISQMSSTLRQLEQKAIMLAAYITSVVEN